MYRNEFIKFDDKVELCVYLWEPKTEPIGIIQLAHGMAEHLGRYDEFGEHFKNSGYLVVGADHYAHGRSVKDSKEIGVIKDYDFIDAIVKSIKLVYQNYVEKYDLPKTLFSHSMGSMVAQSYIEIYPDDFSKAIICGTDAPTFLYALAKVLTKKKGRIGHIEYWPVAENMGVSSFNKKFKKEEDSVAWLSIDLDNRERYRKDPLTGAQFPTNYYYSLAKSLRDSKRKENRAKINKNIKLLLIAGEDDPVGHFGKGPKALNKQYLKLGLSSEVVLFKGRHEILNESSINEDVYAKLDSFIK